MLRDSAVRYAHQMPSLTEDGVAMTLRADEWRLRLVEGRPVPVMESMPEFGVAQTIGTEREGAQSGSASLALRARSIVHLGYG